MKIELSHDILARKIYEKASAEDKMILKMEGIIRSGYERYQERNLLMSSEDYDYVYPFLGAVNITSDERAFVEKSAKAIRRKQQMLNLTIIATIAILTLFGGLASYQANKAQQSNIELTAQRNLLEAQKEKLIEKGDSIREQQKDLEAAIMVAKENARKAELNYLKAEENAKRADQLRLKAVASARIAEQQKNAADSLRKVALAEAARAISESQRADSLLKEAVMQRIIALEQKSRADTLRRQALAEKSRADTLKDLSEARVLANKAIRLIQEGKINEGAKLSLDAYNLNLEKGGPYQNADCYSALDAAYQALEIEESNIKKSHEAAIRAITTDYSKRRQEITAFATEDGKLHVIDQNNYSKIKLLSGRSRSIALSHDGNLLLTGTYDGKLIAHEFIAGRYEKLRLNNESYTGAIDHLQIVEPTPNAYYVAFSDNQNIYIGFVTFVSTKNRFRKELKLSVRKFPFQQVKTLAFSPDGSYVLATNNEVARLYRVRYNFPKLDFVVERSNDISLDGKKVTTTAIGIAQKKDEHLLAIGMKNGGIIISTVENLRCALSRNPENQCEYETQVEHKSPITKLIFNKDGNQLISASFDKTAKIWNIANLDEERIPLIGHRKWIWDVSYNYEQDKIYTVSEDRSIKTWISRPEILARKVQQKVIRNPLEKPKEFRSPAPKNGN